jgi:hypothetical protein
VGPGWAIGGGCHDHLADDQRFDFRPAPADQGDHGPVDTDLQADGTLRAGVGRRGQGGSGGAVLGQQDRPGRVSVAAGAGFTDADSGEVGEQSCGRGKLALGAQAHQRQLRLRGQAAGQQAEFVIQGEKARRRRRGRWHRSG